MKMPFSLVRYYRRRMKKAEAALYTTFGVTAQDVLEADVLEWRLQMSKAPITQSRIPEAMIRMELHKALDKMIDHSKREG